MKKCISCGKQKDFSLFHKHKGMKSGYLNKCKQCVIEYIAKWRKQNPDVRKKEHAKNREKLGFKTRKQYLEQRKQNAKGRKVSSLEHSHKRRLQISKIKLTEFDEFVFAEAIQLKDLRKQTTNIEWHIDHIVPINYKNACGLHNAYNFQVVPAKWNVKKGNRNMDQFFNVTGY